MSQMPLFRQPDIPSEDEEIQEDDDFAQPLYYSITSYGADYVVDGLVKRLQNGSIYVPTFQRGYVWTQIAASRFVESLLLGLPVPGIFLSREEDTQKLLVIDGQQRLQTLNYFYEGIFPGKGEFSLVGVNGRFLGRTYKTLPDEDRRHLDDAIIHATIIRQDRPKDDDSSIYQVFERLNTGGTLLRPHEIRTALNIGPFTDLLKLLNENTSWRALFGAVSPYMRDQELILRFFALYYDSDSYKKPMASFLNRFLQDNRDLSVHHKEELEVLFSTTVNTIYTCLGKKVFKPRNALNAAIFDAVMVGVANNLASLQKADCDRMKEAYERLLRDERFLKATQTATTDEENIETRLGLASKALGGVE